MSHSQKANGLVCGLSTRKMRTPWPIQWSRMSRHASHSAARSASVVRPEVDRVDVLVLLGRVLGVPDRAVGPVVEPLGMLGAPRGGRASTGARSRARPPGRAPRPPSTKASKSSSVPSSGWMAVWPPSARADGPRAARVVGPGVERVVAALAVRAADRVDRRQVDDVEAHVGDGGQPLARRPRSPPSDRGNSSYHALHRATLAVDPQRHPFGLGAGRGIGDVDQRAATSSSSPALSLASRARLVSRSPLAAAARAGRRSSSSGSSAASSSRSRAPSSSSSSTSCPAPALTSTSWRQVAIAVGPRLDDELVAADLGRLDRTPPTGR